jgi:hypothetical protein
LLALGKRADAKRAADAAVAADPKLKTEAEAILARPKPRS